MRTPKAKARWYDPEEFYLARRRAGLTTAKAARMLDVTPRTIRNWESGESRIPFAAFRLMRLFGGHSLLGKQWEGWSMWRGSLWTPEGREFQQHELRYISHYLWMARQWLAERKAAAPLRLGLGSPNPLDSTIPDGEASSGSPASRVPLPLSGAGLRHDARAGKVTGSSLQDGLVSFGNYSEFRSIDGSGKIAANDDVELEVN